MNLGPVSLFAENRFLRVLRFLNMLEPGSRILSISKVYMWVSVFGTLVTFLFHNDNVATVVGATVNQFGSIANYMYRRSVQPQSSPSAVQ